MLPFTGSELSERTGTACHCGTLSRTELDVVYECTERNIRERKSVADFRRHTCAGLYDLSYFQSVRSDNVSLFAIFIFHECNTRTSVRIVLDSHYFRLAVVLVTTEIDDTVHPLVAAADITDGHLTLVVASACLLDRFKQRFIRGLAGNVVKSTDYLVPLSRGYRFEFSYCHCVYLLDVSVKINLVLTSKSDVCLLVVIHATPEHTGLGITGFPLSVIVGSID